jgi:hypothetical protein
VPSLKLHCVEGVEFDIAVESRADAVQECAAIVSACAEGSKTTSVGDDVLVLNLDKFIAAEYVE